MSIPTTHRLAPATIALVLVLPFMTACASRSTGSDRAGPADAEPVSAPATASPEMLEAAARADSVRAFYTQADVDFMRAMLHHHAQALVMARMAPTHDASPSLQTLAARIINSQKDEMALMTRWLRDRDERVPEVDVQGVEGGHAGGHTGGNTGGHSGLAGQAGQAADDAPTAGHAPMAGMLSPDQLRRLDEARGPEWDRLFLQYMIQHHQGAVVMVDELFATHGAGQGDAIFKIAADIGADQSSEIDRMQRMLRDLIFEAGNMP